MYRKLSKSTGNLLGFEVHDVVTEEDVEAMQEELRHVAEERGSVRLLIDVEGLDDAEPSAVWQDLKMMPTYVRGLDRVAIVGDERWHEWSTKVSDLLVEADFFRPGQLDRAWDWLGDGREVTTG